MLFNFLEPFIEVQVDIVFRSSGESCFSSYLIRILKRTGLGPSLRQIRFGYQVILFWVEVAVIPHPSFLPISEIPFFSSILLNGDFRAYEYPLDLLLPFHTT